VPTSTLFYFFFFSKMGKECCTVGPSRGGQGTPLTVLGTYDYTISAAEVAGGCGSVRREGGEAPEGATLNQCLGGSTNSKGKGCVRQTAPVPMRRPTHEQPLAGPAHEWAQP
jgi:hypothetical protein